MIAQNQNPVSRDRSRQMAVANVPGELSDIGAITRRDFVERFVGGDDGNDSAIVEKKRVPRGQDNRLGQIDQDLAAIRQLDRLAAQMTFIVLQHRRAKRGRCMCVNTRLRGGLNSDRPQHAAFSLSVQL